MRKSRKKSTVDIEIRNHGSIALIVPLTDLARQWIDENIHAESWQWWGDGLACEPRYIETIVDGMMDSGLQVA